MKIFQSCRHTSRFLPAAIWSVVKQTCEPGESKTADGYSKLFTQNLNLTSLFRFKIPFAQRTQLEFQNCKELSLGLWTEHGLNHQSFLASYKQRALLCSSSRIEEFRCWLIVLRKLLLLHLHFEFLFVLARRSEEGSYTLRWFSELSIRIKLKMLK